MSIGVQRSREPTPPALAPATTVSTPLHGACVDRGGRSRGHTVLTHRSHYQARTPGAALFRLRTAVQAGSRSILAVHRHGERAGSSKRKTPPRHNGQTVMPIGLIVVTLSRGGGAELMRGLTAGTRLPPPCHVRTPGAALFRLRMAAQTALRPILVPRGTVRSSKRQARPVTR